MHQLKKNDRESVIVVSPLRIHVMHKLETTRNKKQSLIKQAIITQTGRKKEEFVTKISCSTTTIIRTCQITY